MQLRSAVPADLSLKSSAASPSDDQCLVYRLSRAGYINRYEKAA